MKLNIFTFLIITTIFIAVVNTFAQEEIFFDCVPVDYNTTPSRINSDKLYKDKIIIGAYQIDDGKAKIFHEGGVSEILPTTNGFFLRGGRHINFYNESTSSVSNTIDTLLIPLNEPEKYIEVYNEGLFYIPDEDILQEERKGRLHFTDGNIESTFHFKEFEAHYDLGGNRDITKISEFYFIGNLFCHNNEKIYFYVGFDRSQGVDYKSSNIACFDLKTNESYVLLEDRFDEPFFFSNVIIKNNDNLILEGSREIWSLDISTENLQLLATTSSSLQDDYFIVDSIFLLQKDSLNNPEFYENQLLVSDGTVSGTYLHELRYQDTFRGNWLPLEGYTHNDKVYFSARVSGVPHYNPGDILFEVSKDSLINTELEIRDLFKINNHILFTTGMNYRDDAQKILWNYNNGDPVELIQLIEPEFIEIHLDKLYFVIENTKGTYNFVECDGTMDGTRYVIKNSKKPVHSPFLINEYASYYFKQDEILGNSIFKTNPNTNLAELSCVPFPFTESSRINDVSIAKFTYETIYNSNGYYDDDEFGRVIYREAIHTFFIDEAGLWYSDGAPSDAKLVSPTFGMQYRQPYITEFQNKFWFVDFSDFSNQKLFSTDGTVEGTKLEYDYNLSVDLEIGLANNKGIFFKQRNDNIVFYDTGLDTLVNLPIKAFGRLNGIYNDKLIEIDGSNKVLHVSDGTVENSATYYYGDINVEPFLMDDKLLMIDLETRDLYNTNENYKPKDLLVDNFIDNNYYPMANGHMLFYTKEDTEESQYELWVTDGTIQNTKKILNRNLGPYGSFNPETVYDEKKEVLYFSVNSNRPTEPDLTDSLFYYDLKASKLYTANFFNSPTNRVDDISLIDGKVYIKGNNDLFGYEVYYLSEKPVDPLCMNKFLTGSVFLDINKNGIKDGVDYGIPNISILQNDRDIYNIKTDEDGNFYAAVANGAFEIKPNIEGGCFEVSAVDHTYWIDSLTRYSNNLNFGLSAFKDSTLNGSVKIDITSAPTRCGFPVPFWITVSNYTCNTISGKLIINLGENVEFIPNKNPELIDNYSANEHLLTFDLPGLPIFQQKQFKVILRMPGENFVGENIFINTYLNDKDSLLVTFSSEITCAIDPNDKLVTPSREDPESKNYTLLNEQLDYTIRFQNTGTDTAFTVKIVDTLSNKLNYQSIEPIAASHDYTFNITEEGILTFQFDNILLPDSTTNETESHGFVTFNIAPVNELVQMDEIQNNAGIYFDFNQPIITNTVSSTFVEFLDEDMDGYYFWDDCNDKDNIIFENCDSLIMPTDTVMPMDTMMPIDTMVTMEDYIIQIPEFKLFPNPNNGIFEVLLDKNFRDQVIQIEIKNIVGQVKRLITVEPNHLEVQFNIHELNAGLYFCTILLKNGSQISHKLIKI